jgi:histidine triad (HIT) family protein
LVIPVAHRETLLELEPSEGSAIMSSVIAAGRAITLAYKSEGLAVWQNNGRSAHQAIPHVHFHVAGTLPEGGTEWGYVEEDSLFETEAIAARLRPFLT